MLAVYVATQLGQTSYSPTLLPQQGEQQPMAPGGPMPLQSAAVGAAQAGAPLFAAPAAEPTAEAPKKWVKKTHFMVISRPHSGMKWLKDMLNENPDVFCHGEPLLHVSDQYFDDFRRDFAWDHLPAQQNHKRVLQSTTEGFSWFHSQGGMDFLASKIHNASATTSKGTLQRGLDFVKWLVNNDVKLIQLTRQNMLARRISTFGGDEDSVLKSADKKIAVDTSDLIKALQGDEELAYQTAPFLVANQIRKENLRQVKYEDLVADPATELAHIFEFIGATNQTNYDLHEVGKPFRRSEMAKLRHTIENVAEVEEAVKGTKWAQELDQPVWRP
jgi:hypothetical protein